MDGKRISNFREDKGCFSERGYINSKTAVPIRQLFHPLIIFCLQFCRTSPDSNDILLQRNENSSGALAFSIVSVTDIFDRVVTAARAVLTAVDRYFFIYFILI